MCWKCGQRGHIKKMCRGGAGAGTVIIMATATATAPAVAVGKAPIGAISTIMLAAVAVANTRMLM